MREDPVEDEAAGSFLNAHLAEDIAGAISGVWVGREVMLGQDASVLSANGVSGRVKTSFSVILVLVHGGRSVKAVSQGVKPRSTIHSIFPLD